MRAIAAPFFEASSTLVFPVVALCLFVVIFAAVFVRVLRQKSSSFDHLASLPFETDAHEGEPRVQEPS